MIKIVSLLNWLVSKGEPHRRTLALAIHLFLFAFSNFAAFLLRFEGYLGSYYLELILKTLPITVGMRVLFFQVFGLFKGLWRYSSLYDLLKLFQAILYSGLSSYLMIHYLIGWSFYPRSVFMIDGLILLALAGGVRFLRRILKFSLQEESGKRQKRVLIIGAGDAAEMIVRDMKNTPRVPYKPVGFLDDDPAKIKANIHGLKVFGRIDELPRIIERYPIDELLIAIPSASGKTMRRILEICKGTGLRYRTIPGITELVDGKVSIGSIREVAYGDLLGRELVRLDEQRIGSYLEGKRVLITGAGGSIGSELCRQVARFEPQEMILIDRSECNLYNIEIDIRQDFPNLTLILYLGAVQNTSLIERAFSSRRPHVVFHAAAYKHVPMMESNPWEAIYNNVVGTKVIAEAAAKYRTERFVLVSSDKAVRPTSVMGASKRLAEFIILTQQDAGETKFMAVRFGNVAGSDGSVIPLFKKQIERGGPVTVTHPEITRYFMTIHEAAQLILQTGAMGNGGEIFILDMGTPIKIVDMANDLIRLSGLEPDIDIEIKFIGLRPGEKLHEELMTEQEGVARTPHEKIRVLCPKNPIDNNKRSRKWIEKKIGELIRLADKQDANGIKRKIQEVIPDYKPYLSN